MNHWIYTRLPLSARYLWHFDPVPRSPVFYLLYHYTMAFISMSLHLIILCLLGKG